MRNYMDVAENLAELRALMRKKNRKVMRICSHTGVRHLTRHEFKQHVAHCESLIAAYRISQDLSAFREAMQWALAASLFEGNP